MSRATDTLYQTTTLKDVVKPGPITTLNIQMDIYIALIGLLTATEKQVHLGRLHEAHSMASQKQLEDTGITRKSDPYTQISTSSFAMVAQGRQCPHRPTITPHATRSANLYRHIKRRVGRSLK